MWNLTTFKFASEENKEAQSQFALNLLDEKAMERMFGLKNAMDEIECK